MNIQDELQKIHHQHGTTEKANYEIQKMFDSEINKYKKKAEKWDKLGNEIEKYYESEDEDNNDDEYDREEGNLLDIGEAAASAYGYL
jgi:hypothetical protein